MKRILSIVLVALFAISLVGFASAAEDEMGSMATPAPVKKHKMTHKKKATTPAATPAPAPETK